MALWNHMPRQQHTLGRVEHQHLDDELFMGVWEKFRVGNIGRNLRGMFWILCLEETGYIANGELLARYIYIEHEPQGRTSEELERENRCFLF